MIGFKKDKQGQNNGSNDGKKNKETMTMTTGGVNTTPAKSEATAVGSPLKIGSAEKISGDYKAKGMDTDTRSKAVDSARVTEVGAVSGNRQTSKISTHLQKHNDNEHTEATPQQSRAEHNIAPAVSQDNNTTVETSNHDEVDISKAADDLSRLLSQKNKKHEQAKNESGQADKTTKSSFSLFKKKPKLEGIKNKMDSLAIVGPITAAYRDFATAQSTSASGVRVIDRYSIREPVIHVTVARDEIGSPVYLIEEPILTDEEKIVYSQLMDKLQYELKAPYDSVKTNPKEYFDEEAKKIITKYALSMGVTPNVTWNKVYYYITRDMIGFGPLEAIMSDPNIEDVSIDGVDKDVYIWHKKYESLKTNLVFKTEKELDDTIIRLVHMSGKHISTAYPIVDATLPGRHRLVATFRKEVSRYGSTVTIRKFREDPFTVVDLLNFKTFNHEIAAYSWLLMEHSLSSIIVGSTASGKTTLLNALVSMTKPSSKIVTIEETQEINIHHQNWVPLISRLGYGGGAEKIGEVSLFDLVRASMRMRPDILIVGEVRGEEAYVLFQAISTGHGGMCTLHADDVESAVQRLTSKPMDVAPIHMKFLDLMFAVRNISVTDPITKKPYRTRRVLAVTEIMDYNKYNQVFHWDPATDTHVMTKGSLHHSEKLKVISKDTGKSMDELIEDIKGRELILRWLQKNDIRNFKDLGRIFEKYHENKKEFLSEVRAHLGVQEEQKAIVAGSASAAHGQ
jgi:archaeal flagellar protein FlaI